MLGISIPPEKTATPVSRKEIEDASAIFALDILVLRELDNSLESQFPDLRHKMRLFREIAGMPESVLDCADEKRASISSSDRADL